MDKRPALKRPDHARTNRAVREAISDVKGASRPRVSSVKDGVSWLIALGAGAAVIWKSWKVAQEPPSQGHDNASAQIINAQLEREKRRGEQLSASVQQSGGIDSQNARNVRSADPSTSLVRPSRSGRTARIDPPPPRAPTQEDTAREHAARDASAPDGAAKVEGGALTLAKEFYKRFNEDEVTTRAAALAFVGVFSLVPIMLFAVVALGFVFRDPAEATKHVQQFVAQMLPGESASRAANDVLAQTHLVETAQGMTQHVGFPLFLGIGSLLWAGISLFVTASTPMNAAWDVTETRNFIKLRLTALGVLLGAGLVFVLSIGVSALPHLVSNLDWPLFGPKGFVPVWATLLTTLLAIALDAAMFVLIYKFLPNAKVTWKAALVSGLATGLAWEALKQGFGFYLAHFGNSNNKLYGALGGIVLLITWIYYSCTFLLSGAEIGKMYHEHKEEGGVNERAPRMA